MDIWVLWATEYICKPLTTVVKRSMADFHDFHASFIKLDETRVAVAVSNKEVSPRGDGYGRGLTEAHGTVPRDERFAESEQRRPLVLRDRGELEHLVQRHVRQPNVLLFVNSNAVREVKPGIKICF